MLFHVHTCAYSGASAHFNPLIAPHANRLNRVLLHTLHSVIFVSSACSRTREAARSARTRARMNGSASDSRALLDGASRTARCCADMCMYAVALPANCPWGYAIGLPGRGFLCSFCPPRMHQAAFAEIRISRRSFLPLSPPTSPSVLRCALCKRTSSVTFRIIPTLAWQTDTNIFRIVILIVIYCTNNQRSTLTGYIER